MLTLGNDKHWYALYCKSRHEHKVNARLLSKGFVTYLADYQTRAQWGTRLRNTRRNLLPGYVLVQAQIDSSTYLHILQTESVLNFVGQAWPRLSWIPDAQVNNLRCVLESGERFEETTYWQQGETVEIIAGPLQGVSGIVAGMTNRQHRVVISIDLLQRGVAVEMDSSFLRRLPPIALTA
ncbi:MAG: Transcription antitermination protein RfaH [bacterium]|nr:Transcription antitermination protein RfaH [bacterium]